MKGERTQNSLFLRYSKQEMRRRQEEQASSEELKATM